MNLRYYMRGLGVGMLVTALILSLNGIQKKEMTDEEIKARAESLGMVDSAARTLVTPQPVVKTAEPPSPMPTPIVTATPTATATSTPSPAPTPIVTATPTLIPTPVVTATQKPVVTKKPAATQKPIATPKPVVTKNPVQENHDDDTHDDNDNNTNSDNNNIITPTPTNDDNIKESSLGEPVQPPEVAGGI